MRSSLLGAAELGASDLPAGDNGPSRDAGRARAAASSSDVADESAADS